MFVHFNNFLINSLVIKCWLMLYCSIGSNKILKCNIIRVYPCSLFWWPCPVSCPSTEDFPVHVLMYRHMDFLLSFTLRKLSLDKNIPGYTDVQKKLTDLSPLGHVLVYSRYPGYHSLRFFTTFFCCVIAHLTGIVLCLSCFCTSHLFE